MPPRNSTPTGGVRAATRTRGAHRDRTGAPGGCARRLRSAAEAGLTWRGAIETSRTIRSEGALLPLDLLRRVLDPRSGLPGTTPEDYGLPAGERLNEAITQSWNSLRKHWTEFREVAANLPAGRGGHRPYQRQVEPAAAARAGVRVPAGDRRPRTGRTHLSDRPFLRPGADSPGSAAACRSIAVPRGNAVAAAANPHGLVQEFLNRSDAHLWAVVSNGLRLRVLRDNQALSRQSFLDFDLEDDVCRRGLLRLRAVVADGARDALRTVRRRRPESCRLEQWTQEAERLGPACSGTCAAASSARLRSSVPA